ncbi:hypothetical protein ABFS82_06G005200 [Erythranthe guttata]|uniref:Uncharacterized protein n=1 Tax=Erythranthe guttata TaxID=4155 RepID=A0A022RZJ2_ERYGU|nr:hypothetical protein MIMGU_mgv1a016151mg [Erythranthe guttata]
MDSTGGNKRRSLISRSKLVMSIYRAAKGSPANHQQPINKPATKLGPTSSSSSKMAGGIIIVNQDQQTPKVAFVVKERNRDSYRKLENFYGGAAEDEAVDAKAARYISNVQERFRLERVNSDRKINYDEFIHL